MESRKFTAPSRAPPLPPNGVSALAKQSHGTNASAHVLGQIGSIVESALQDTRTHIARHRAEAGDHHTVVRLQKYLLSIKKILEAARDQPAGLSPDEHASEENEAMDDYTVIPTVGHAHTQPAATPSSRSTKVGAVQTKSQNSHMDPAAKVDARWDSFGEDSSRLKEELHKTMERLTQLKQDMLPPQAATQNINAIESRKAQRISNPAGPTGPLSPSRHGTADFIDTGESRLSQMSSIEEKLMGMDERAPGTRYARAFEESRQRPMLVPAEKLDPETMSKWQEIFRHRTRPQHPDSNKISQLPPMERVELETPVINVKDQHKDRVRTLCGPRLPTVFTVPSDSRQQHTQKQQQLQQQQSIPQQKNWQYMHRPEGSYYTVMRTSGGGGDSRQTQRTSGGGGDSRQTQQPTQVSSASMYSGYATASSQNTRYSTNAHTMSPHQGPHSQMGMPRNQSPYNNSTGRVMMSPAGSSAMRSPSNPVSSNVSYRDSYGYHQHRASQSNFSRSSTSGANVRAPSPNLWAQQPRRAEMSPYGYLSPHSTSMHRW